MKPRILLINAPTIKTRSVGADNYFPMGLLYLASVVKKNGMEAQILDVNNHFFRKGLDETLLNGYLESDLRDYVIDYRPDVIGIGCTFSGAFKSLKIIAANLKEIFPSTPIVIGGIHATLFAREILDKYDFIDYVVVGEGETTFLELIMALSGNRPLSPVDGIAFRDSGGVKLNPKTKFENDLDALPFVDYGIVNMADYRNDTSGWYSPKKIAVGQPFTLISSRSCPNRCVFCSMWLVHGPKIRFRSPGNVLDEMERLYNNCNARYFQFMDDNITFDKKRILDICDGIRKRNMDIQFDTPNGLAINKLDQEIIDALVGAGLVYMSLGIESGSDYIRNKIMRKGLETKKIHQVVEGCAKYKHLFIKGFFIIGMPEDTHETLQETYDMIRMLPFDKINVNFAALYPGTELFNYCASGGLFQHKKQDYMNIEIFQDSDDRPHFTPYKLKAEDLILFRQKCFDYMSEKRRDSGLPENVPLRSKN